jgi:hypothetical protein
MADKKDKEARVRVVLGFQGGGTLPLKLTEADSKQLLDALGSGEWHDIADADGPVRVNLSQVAYVRSEADDHQVGFGLG